jgi:cobalt-zinc-cadmium efflux system protein
MTARHHSHGHSHAHAHRHPVQVEAASARRLWWALVLTGGFMLVEVIGGVLSGSLALIADAGHMVTDAAALGLALAAFRFGQRPHDLQRSYGYHRFQVLAAFVNGLALLAVVAWIAFEAVMRLLDPVPVLGGPMLAVALAGLGVNLAAFLVLRGSAGNLNVRGAAVHVLGDLLGSLAAIAAASVILGTGWTPIDPLLSVLVAALVLRSAIDLTRRSAHILLEGAPDWLDLNALRAELHAAVPEVADVHHVHVWMLTEERPLMTLHAQLRAGADQAAVLGALIRHLEESYGVGHVTVQIEPPGWCHPNSTQDKAHPC